MAHVEAPTFGSMILAGILLKLGGIGLIRFSSILSFLSIKFFLFSYFLFFLVFSAVICCIQSDFKRLVAYSSVSHIIAVPILLLSSSNLSQVAIVRVIVFHGLRSPILFSLVGLLYSIYSTRQLVLIRGLITFSPLLSFVTVISFLFSLSAPPYPSFFSEVLFFLRAVCLSFSCLPFFLLFAFLSLVYNLN
jgi:NADH:ubiquinone oxidoreductase subunit 4 (subunit M)